MFFLGFFFWFCNFFGLIFVIKGVPRGVRPDGGGGGVPGCPGICRLQPEGVPGVFRACSRFYRHPILAWTPDPYIDRSTGYPDIVSYKIVCWHSPQNERDPTPMYS